MGKDPKLATKLNNARAEGIAAKPSFRQALRRRRCLLPASGFYEWQSVDGVKQPWYISPRGAERGAPPFAFAGLFEAWRPAVRTEDTEWLLTCCVITTAPNGVMAPIHDRMPVILPPETWAAWLSRELQDPATLTPLLVPAPTATMQAWPVSRTVNRSSSEGEALESLTPV